MQINCQLPQRLKILKVCKNRLVQLPEFPPTLEIIKCKKNRLGTLPNSILGCQRLRNINYEGNPIILNEEILNFFERVIPENMANEENQIINNNNLIGNNNINIPKTIYNDSQNVHDTQVTNEIKKNIKYLKSIFENNKKLKSIYYDDKTLYLNKYKELIKKHKLIDKYNDIKYLCDLDTKHSELNMTISDIFILVFNRIINHECEKEILKTLNEDINEMMNVCFTGRISRLINCLSGYDDKIFVGINENQQIQSRISIILKNIGKIYKNDSIEYNIICKYKIIENLKEINIKEDIIKVWTDDFTENINDYLKENDIKNIKINENFKKYFDEFFLDK